MRRPGRWLVADRGALKPGEIYNVAVRMELDVAQLPKPFQVHAINSSDWRLCFRLEAIFTLQGGRT